MSRSIKILLWLFGLTLIGGVCLALLLHLMINHGWFRTNDGYFRFNALKAEDALSRVLVQATESHWGLSGQRTQLMRETKKADLRKIRLREYGKFYLLYITEPELVEWPMLEGATIHGLAISGQRIPPEAWLSLKKVRKLNGNLTFELTDQPLDHTFYQGLSTIISGRSLGSLAVEIVGFDWCKVQPSFKNLKVLKTLKPKVTELPAISRQRIMQQLESAEDINRAFGELHKSSYQIYLANRFFTGQASQSIEDLTLDCTKKRDNS